MTAEDRKDAEVNLDKGWSGSTSVVVAVPWDAPIPPPTPPVPVAPEDMNPPIAPALTGDALAKSLFKPGMTKKSYEDALKTAGFTAVEAKAFSKLYWVKAS